MAWKIPLFQIYNEDDDHERIKKVIQRGSYWTTGPEVEQFEKDTARYVGQKYAVSFTNGTAALHIAMLAMGIGPGDEVIVPAFTFISTANSPLFVGAKPVFADIEKTTYGLDPADIASRITPKTKAIMPVHIGGTPCDIHEIQKVAKENDLLLIEDAAEAFGAKIGDKFVGSIGDVNMFSFCQNKVITTGEGGMLVTDDLNMYQKMKLLRSHGRADDRDYFSSTQVFDYISLGYNLRMSSITAALGLSQLEKVEKIISMRREVASKYNDALSNLSGLQTPMEKPGCRNVYQLYSVLFDSHESRDRTQKTLADKGVMSKVYFDPIYNTQFYKSFGKVSLPVTEDISRRVLTLPLYPGMSDEDISYVVTIIEESLKSGD